MTYLHPILEPILKDTFGVILYQEQVMQIASAMGGFSLGQADLMRRAMGKKKESVPQRRNGNPLYKVLLTMASKSPLQTKYLTCSFTLPAMDLINPIVQPMRTLRTKQRISRRTTSQNLWLLP